MKSEKLVREMLGLQNGETEKLPTILEILEERILLLYGENKPKLLKKLK